MTRAFDGVDAALDLHRQLARQVRRLDDELSLHHGIAWVDLLLLDALQAAGSRQAAARLAAATGRSPAGLLRQVLPLEKVGLLRRVADAGGPRELQLAPGGARVLREARATAAEVLADPVHADAA